MDKTDQVTLNLKSLVDMLASADTESRARARRLLITQDNLRYHLLTIALQNSPDAHFRWEAAKTLSLINDRMIYTIFCESS